jgi:predicted DNA-binding transcriptional regulator AlpA
MGMALVRCVCQICRMDDNQRVLLSYEDLKAFGITYSRMTLWRRQKDGTFPKAVRLGGNRIAWRRDEILAFIDGLERSGTLR